MKGFDSRAKRAVAVAEPERDQSLCIANGCPCRASVDLGGTKRFACRYHAFADAQAWPRITEGLHGHGWLMDLMADLRRLDLSARDGWRAYATEFWAESEPAMVPQPGEGRDLYLYRLHLSLAFRVGARTTAPTVLVPAGAGLSKRCGNMAELLRGAA